MSSRASLTKKKSFESTLKAFSDSESDCRAHSRWEANKTQQQHNYKEVEGIFLTLKSHRLVEEYQAQKNKDIYVSPLKT